MIKYNKNIIIALDFVSTQQAKEFIINNKIDPSLCRVKVGHALFTAGGPDLIKWLVDRNFDVFLDLKFHDIPNTVKYACLAAADLGVWMLTIHAMGGLEMLSAAKQGIQESIKFNNANKPLIMAVTVLTSFDTSALNNINITASLEQQVLKLADLSLTAKVDGIVCSGLEVKLIKSKYNNKLKILTPGIRLANNNTHDQKRIMTPQEALSIGSDYLVIGRAITESQQPKKVLEDIINNLSSNSI